MKTIRAKFNLSLMIIFISGGYFGYQAYVKYRSIEVLQSQLSQSFILRSSISKLDIKHIDLDHLKKVQILKRRLQEEKRRESVSNVIQAYNAKNPRLFQVRLEEFSESELEFTSLSFSNIRKLRKNLKFFIGMALSVPLIGFGFLFYYFNFKIALPLDLLRRRMMSFLVDQYSFRMTSPKNNEIGHLEGTFNALAQRVLNNIEELKALDSAKSEFVSITSHELRTPLTSIKGSLGMLTSGISGTMDEEARELVVVADQETDRLVRLINDLLDLAKIESKSLTLKKEWVPFSEILKTSINGIHGFSMAAKVNIEEHAECDDVLVNVDADRIQQVLTNLISNAIKYSPEQGTVTVSYRVDVQNALLVSVIDQGPGISMENQEQIFEKFRQATDSSTPLVKGTGLGLAISKALVSQHNGEIGVDSTPDEGATFFFSIKEWKPYGEHSQQDSPVKQAA